MTALILTADNVLTVKRAVRDVIPDAKSSHLSEAMAAAAGYSKHAALLADIERRDPRDPEIRLLDEVAFFRRLSELGVDAMSPDDGLGLFAFLRVPEDGKILIKTRPASADAIDYTSIRARAWRNVMVAAVNTAVEQRLISVRPGDNRWPGWTPDRAQQHRQPGGSGAVFRFTIGDIPAIGYVGDAGFDEVSVHVALWPTDRGEEWVSVGNAGFNAGDVFASGWLERRTGAWLQYSVSSLKCRKQRLETVASLDIKPTCFGDRGRLIM
ncbi:hypothetical protein [Azospirillum soli]|uniref:hypothetical protein n=1 Tax=Azospirillum soli TaxID=1304799 RepID=UPI001AE2F60F|nr:hypothetical protein [Azospirillum soli]MBP2315516.1 hypothetical protein [Azospirillum soli]